MLHSLSYLLLTYLVASIPSGLIVGILHSDRDPREEGSGNIGASNVYRLMGAKPGLLTLSGDMLKGMLPTLLAMQIFASVAMVGMVAVTAFLGHCFSGYLAFRGGKGVATAGGALLAMSPVATIVGIAMWACVFWGTRKASIASLTVAGVMPILIWTTNPAWIVWSVILTIGVGIRHRANIERLQQGTEL